MTGIDRQEERDGGHPAPTGGFPLLGGDVKEDHERRNAKAIEAEEPRE
jgi:hypothetical protein